MSGDPAAPAHMPEQLAEHRALVEHRETIRHGEHFRIAHLHSRRPPRLDGRPQRDQFLGIRPIWCQPQLGILTRARESADAITLLGDACERRTGEQPGRLKLERLTAAVQPDSWGAACVHQTSPN
jgi:hypothetical protein